MRTNPTSAPPGAATLLQLPSRKGARRRARASPEHKPASPPPATAEVVSIYRPGDRVLVEYPPGFYEVVIQSTGFEGGRLWLYGVGRGVAFSFTARQVARRLGLHERIGWPAAV